MWHAPLFTCSLTWLWSPTALAIPCSGLSPVHRPAPPAHLQHWPHGPCRQEGPGHRLLLGEGHRCVDTWLGHVFGTFVCPAMRTSGCSAAEDVPLLFGWLRHGHWWACGCERPAAQGHTCCWPASWFRLRGALLPASPRLPSPPASPAPFTHAHRSLAALCRPFGQAGGDSERDQPGGSRLAAEHGPGWLAAAYQWF